MASTPPPPSQRLRTPAAPFHGPKYDAYEPYSPRRSSRIHSRRDQPSFSENVEPGSNSSGAASKYRTDGRSLGSQKTPKRPNIKRTSSQTFSPPSSPISPGHTLNLLQGRQSAHRLESARRPTQASDVDSDDMSGLQPQRLFRHGIPTPAKTPRKKTMQAPQQLHSTARVLFPSLDDVVPTPRKARKSKVAVFASDDMDEAPNTDGIQIYTDSKERVPEEVTGEDNPFMSRRSNRRTQPPLPTTGPKVKYGMTNEIDEAVERGEGMVYTFRGKKFYRKFNDGHIGERQHNGHQLVGDGEAQRQAGYAAGKSLSRKDIKPRRLFPLVEPPPNPDDADEEAMTDIEPEPEHNKHAEHNPSGSQIEVTTPTRQSFGPTTPPTSVKRGRTTNAAHSTSPMSVDDHSKRTATARSVRMKTSPFEDWQRTKPGVSKRLHDELVAEGSPADAKKGKRTKN